MKPPRFSLYQGFSCALAGIVNTLKSEATFKVHLVAALLVVAMGLFFRLTAIEWLWVALSITLVMAAELINTAIESLADLVSSEYHPLIKKTKDAAAGAVLITALFAIISGLVIFIPKLIEAI